MEFLEQFAFYLIALIVVFFFVFIIIKHSQED